MARSRPVTMLPTLAVVGVLLLAAGCAGSPAASSNPPSAAVSASPAESSSASASPVESTGASPSASAAAGGSTLALQAQDFSYTGPSTVEAGVTTVTLENVGKETHQAQIVRINDDKAFSDLTTALATGDPTAALGIVTLGGGPTAVPAGQTGETTQNLEPGNYAFLCFIAGADGVPHLAKGMIMPLTVTGTASGGTVPAGDATVVAKDFSFDVPTAVSAGAEHTFTFTNEGPQPHEAGIVKLTGGMTVEQLQGMFTASPAPSGEEPQGPPPFEDYGGIGAIAPGATASLKATLEPGQQYAFICFVPDPATGKAHAELGMIAAIPTQ
jgi:plastocyanin